MLAHSPIHPVRRTRTAALATAAATLLAFAGAANPAQAQKFTPIYSFGVTDASQTAPGGPLVQDGTSKMYGELNFNESQIYSISPGGRESVLWTAPLYSVCYTGMTMGTDGLLYGTCWEWENNDTNGGVVFQFNPKKKQNRFKIIYSFPAFGNGGYEYPSGLTLGTDGNFYGTTLGDLTNPYGTVFKVTPQGVYTTLHIFQGASQNDGANPSDVPTGDANINPIPLILGSDGNFYGTTNGGGLNGQQNGGTAYQITPEGTVTILYYFPNGTNGLAGVTEQNGNFFGQTAGGGANDDGSIYELTPGGVLTTLHSFNQTADSAAIPDFLLTIGNDGNFYDASSDYASGGFGPESLYEITPAGTYADVYNGFGTPYDCPTTCLPNSPLYLHTNGKFYGVTGQGGEAGRGEFYSLKPREAAPFARLQLPAAKPGTWIGIIGQGFTKTTNVLFNGKSAKFELVSDGFLRAEVPAGISTGRVAVKMPGQELRSNTDFTPLR